MKLQGHWPLNDNIMKTRKNKIVKFEDHLNKEYGKRGSVKREKYEQGFESFKLGVRLQELRKQRNMTQEQLAEKCGTTKTYISRIENDASDIRLSTLLRIIRDGLGGRISISISG
jgi:HTH-type transcriptional regulator / antitoxin HipB